MFKCDKVRLVEFSDKLMKNTKVSKVMLSVVLGATTFLGGVAISAEVLTPSDKEIGLIEEAVNALSIIALGGEETQIGLPSSVLVIVDKQKQLEEIKAEGIRLQREQEEAEKLRLAKLEAERKANEEAERKALEEAEKRLEEIERQKVIAEQKKQQAQDKGVAYNGSYYTPYCTGCSGITKTGVDVRNTIYHQGMRVVAVDPRVIPLHSIVQVTTPHESFKAIALDTGGAIKGHKIDILVADKATAISLGRHTVYIKVLRSGK